MTKLLWDQVGQRIYETGVDHGVLYIPDNAGVYSNGYAWNGLTGITESPGGAEANQQYADNIVYVNLQSAETYAATIEAFTYPLEFEQCDGTASPAPGLSLGQQGRKTFGLSYRTLVGNDLSGTDYAYKIHLVYGAQAAPSERSYTTVNDSPEALTFSWEVSTTPVQVPGYKAAATLTINSKTTNPTTLAAIEDILYGTSGTDPRLPMPGEIIGMLAGTNTSVTPTVPTYNSTTKVITIPTVTGVQYLIDGVVKTGTVTITKNTIVKARTTSGYVFPPDTDPDWQYTF